jgi:hypothetical protein
VSGARGISKGSVGDQLVEPGGSVICFSVVILCAAKNLSSGEFVFTAF